MKRGFTLIELLVVITVIGILAGIVFKMMVRATQSAATAETAAKLEQVANALNEFRAEYGQYPPVDAAIRSDGHDSNAWENVTGPAGAIGSAGQLVKYEFEDPLNQAPYLKNNYFFHPEDWPASGDHADQPVICRKGLLSFLLPRDPSDWPKDVLWSVPPSFSVSIVHKDARPGDPDRTGYEDRAHGWEGDTERDLYAKNRWAPFLRDIVNVGHERDYRTAKGLLYLNGRAEILDAWDRSIVYESKPPYQSFKLWSRGPDGKSGTDDDIKVGQLDR